MLQHPETLASACINDIAFAYMQNGTLPEHNTTCADMKMSYDPEYVFPERFPVAEECGTRSLAERRVGSHASRERILQDMKRWQQGWGR